MYSAKHLYSIRILLVSHECTKKKESPRREQTFRVVRDGITDPVRQTEEKRGKRNRNKKKRKEGNPQVTQ